MSERPRDATADRIDWLNRHDGKAWSIAFSLVFATGIFLANPVAIAMFGFVMSEEGRLASVGAIGFGNGFLLYLVSFAGLFFPRFRPWAVLLYLVHLVLMLLVFSAPSPAA